MADLRSTTTHDHSSTALGSPSEPSSSQSGAAAASVLMPRAWRLAFVSLLMALGLGVGVGVAAPQPAAAGAVASPGNVYELRASGTDQQMTVSGQSTAESALVVTEHMPVHLSRSWRLVDSGAGDGYYQLRNAKSGLCLEIAGAIAPANTPAQQYRCDPNYRNQPNQLWKLLPNNAGDYVLRNKASGLNLYRTEQGSILQSRASTAWTLSQPGDVYLMCTGRSYGGDCMGDIEVPNTPTPLRQLSQSSIEGRSILSVLVPSTRTLALFSDRELGGTCKELASSDRDLSDDPNLRSLSDLPRPYSAVLGMTCPTGLAVCRDAGFQRCSAPLQQNGSYNIEPGNDDASSLYVKPGLTFAIYSDVHGEGTCETFTSSDVNLSDNTIGDGRASSIIVGHRCDQDVQLCEHNDLGGRCISFRSDKPSLRLTDIGNDTVSSVRVPAGWQISLHSDDNYHGLVDPVDGPKAINFGPGSTSAPNDSASSLDVRATPPSTETCATLGCMA